QDVLSVVGKLLLLFLPFSVLGVMLKWTSDALGFVRLMNAGKHTGLTTRPYRERQLAVRYFDEKEFTFNPVLITDRKRVSVYLLERLQSVSTRHWNYICLKLDQTSSSTSYTSSSATVIESM
ncbi:6817_t:CDS:2, partial [Paraglomus occultum]